MLKVDELVLDEVVTKPAEKTLASQLFGQEVVVQDLPEVVLGAAPKEVVGKGEVWGTLTIA